MEFVRSLGADITFNYKTTSTKEVLAKEGPVNVYVTNAHGRLLNLKRSPFSYWDNVGGESLEAALEYAAQKAQFIVSRSQRGYPPSTIRHTLMVHNLT